MNRLKAIDSRSGGSLVAAPWKNGTRGDRSDSQARAHRPVDRCVLAEGEVVGRIMKVIRGERRGIHHFDLRCRLLVFLGEAFLEAAL